MTDFNQNQLIIFPSELSKRPKINAIYNHMDKKASIQKVMNNQNA